LLALSTGQELAERQSARAPARVDCAAMGRVARYGHAVAKSGRGDELAARLIAAADDLAGDPGCELYLVNRSKANEDEIWVTELWRSQADLDASLERIRGSDDVEAVMELVDSFETIELDLLGGREPPGAAPEDGSPYTIRRLTDVKDSAPDFGLSAMGEARFASDELDASQTGVSHQRLRPETRQAFGHRHKSVEEVYVVLSGSGRVKLDDEILEIGKLDAIRIAPGVTRAFEGGPDGLELLVFSARRPQDAVPVPGWWSD
jgi:mannose-6-phosphate isomerase-like protein (cupin superfamily)/quinol monooxygenase YgiN